MIFLTNFANNSSFDPTLLLSLLEMLGGLGAFLVAVKIMSDTMNQLTNVGLRKLFQRLDNNRFLGVGLGALTSAVLHSSAITTVMVVGFVNSGMMALTEAVTIIMGANIGTTFTALVAAFGASFDFMAYATVLTLVGMMVCSIAKKERARNVGYMIAGLGLIFVSLQFMQAAVAPIKESPAVREFIGGLSNPFLMVLIGIVFTFVLQSSTALTTILISMADVFCITIGGQLGITNAVLYVILGSNIGTCFTTIIASMGANTNAKRAAFLHLLFNLLGSVLYFVLLVCWQDFAVVTLDSWIPGKPGLQIAVFHTIFNTSCTLIFLPFCDLLVKIATLIIPADTTAKTREVLYIDDRFLPTPSIALYQAKKEARHIGDLVMETCDLALDAFLKTDVDAEAVVVENLSEIAELNQKVVKYLVNISANASTNMHSEGSISSMYYVLGDILRVGDLSTNICKYTRKVNNGEITFNYIVYTEIKEMYDKVREMYDIAMDCFLTKDDGKLSEVERAEDEIDRLRRQLVNKHIERLNKGECNPESNGVFVNLVGNIERMADHLTFIAESIHNRPGDNA